MRPGFVSHWLTPGSFRDTTVSFWTFRWLLGLSRSRFRLPSRSPGLPRLAWSLVDSFHSIPFHPTPHRDQRPGGLPGFSLPTGDPTSSPVIHTAVTQSRSLLERTPLKCGSVPEATADAPALMDIPDLQDEPPRKRTEASSASKRTRRIRISSARWSPVWWRCSMSSTTGRNLRSGAS